MKDYKAFVVIGGESTGTRLLTRILIEAGCYGDSGHEQRIDRDIHYTTIPTPFVWRRSMPHNKAIVDLDEGVVCPILQQGIELSEICFLITTRNWMCAMKSAVKAGHSHNVGMARANLEAGYLAIFRVLSMYDKIDFEIVSYDFLVTAKQVYVQHILDSLDISFSEKVKAYGAEIYNGNEPYVWEKVSGER